MEIKYGEASSISVVVPIFFLPADRKPDIGEQVWYDGSGYTLASYNVSPDGENAVVALKPVAG